MSPVDLDRALRPLKDFQRDTVEYVFRRLYTDPEATRRFLVADEVGLGKTMVARGVIAKAINHLDGKVGRIDVIYVCSNAAIAQQNLARLDVLDAKFRPFATRLTLLARQIREVAKQPVNFVSFTPGTTFDLKSRAGRADERVVLYQLLLATGRYGATPLRNLLCATVTLDNWKRMIRDAPDDLDDSIRVAFDAALSGDRKLATKVDDACGRFARHRDDVPPGDGSLQYEVIGALRQLLAKCCIDALEPDLIVLDEFQRFKDLLSGESEAAELAQRLFDYPDARVLLLSATPYRMLTLDAEEDRHEEDFLRTFRFLADDDTRTDALRVALSRFRQALLGTHDGRAQDARDARDAVQGLLSRVMCRTERVARTRGRDAMLREVVVPAPIDAGDVAQAVLADGVARAVGSGDVVEYWKSAPYLLSFLRDYVLDQALRKRAEHPPAGLVDLLHRDRTLLLRQGDVQDYRQIPMANARLRAVAAETLGRGQWKLLWLPPSVPYLAPTGRYADVDAAAATKSLLFSAWNAAPDAIAALLSYEAERRVIEAAAKVGTFRYEDFARKRRPLLNFRLDAERRPAGMPALALLYPSLTLASHVDPLDLALDLGDGRPAELAAVRARIAERFAPLLARLAREHGDTSDGAREDERWYWAFGPLLDARSHPPVVDWVTRPTGLLGLFDEETDEDATADAREKGFAHHVELLRSVMRRKERLGAMPRDLLTTVADLALAAPGVCAARSLHRVCGFEAATDPALLLAAAQIARGFRVLFNVPETIELLQADEGREPYWRAVLGYCVEGNLQAVLDEYAHLLVESTGAIGKEPGEVARSLSQAMISALSPRTASLTVREVRPLPKDDRIRFSDFRVRCRFALRFGEIRDESGASVTRAEVVRDAFNSPFRPFVLASTSIGQEGLDFHSYCHVVYHWNLPSNPVDLEQREGRVHRYKGHAVRRNVGLRYGLMALRHRWTGEGDPWARLFELAAADRPEGASELEPYWIFETPDGHAVERRVPMLPMSREVKRLETLKRSLALYRLVFGQPRQQDLLAYLVEGDRSTGLDDVHISLAPPPAPE